MIPYLSQPSILSKTPIARPFSPIILPPNFETLSFFDKLKSIGLIDNNFKLLFNLSHIPPIGKLGQEHFKLLMDTEVKCCTINGEVLAHLKHSDYISGFAKELKEEDIEIQSYLRGGYAAYVACLGDYFEFLIQKFLTDQKLQENLFDTEIQILKNQDQTAEVPHDVDLFDLVLTDNIQVSDLCHYHIQFLAKEGNYKRIKSEGFIQLLIPKVSPIFPYAEDYVLFTAGDRKGKLQTDRIIGRLHHEYLHSRDDIRIEIQNNQIGIPESAGNFWQMVIDRTLKIVRTESWHGKDFRSGLAAIQLIQNDHILIEKNCSLESIIRHALSTGFDKVFSGAIDRAKLHSKNHYGFLMSVLIAYSHVARLHSITIPEKHLQILTDAILETGSTIPSLANLYQLALLLTCYEDQTNVCHAEWDATGNGLLILYVNDNRIVFPKNFALKSNQSLFTLKLKHSNKKATCPTELIHELLKQDNALGYLERVLFEIALKKPLTPLSGSLLDALVQYLNQTDIEEERAMLASLMPNEFLNAHTHIDWIKALFDYSFKHGLELWNASKITWDDATKWKVFEAIIDQIVLTRPNQTYDLIVEEVPPKELRLEFLKNLRANKLLNKQTSNKILNELLDGDSLSYLERIELELALQNPTTPLTESILDILVQYLTQTDIEEERAMLASLMPNEFLNARTNIEWIKALFNYSFKHGLKLWNASKITWDDATKWEVFEAFIDQIVLTRPNQAYALIEEETPPIEVRIKLLKKIRGQESLSKHTSIKIIYELLDSDSLDYLERIELELSLHNQRTPLTESVKDTLIQYLTHTYADKERINLASIMPKEFLNAHKNIEWIKVLLHYSFKHGLKLWNALKMTMDDATKWKAFEEVIDQITLTRPNHAFVLIEEELPPKTLRLKSLTNLIENETLSLQTSAKIIEGFIEEKAIRRNLEPFIIRTLKGLPPHQSFDLGKKLPPSPPLLMALDHIITYKEDLLEGAEEWFLYSNPSKERINQLVSSKNKNSVELFIKWIEWKISLKHEEEASIAFQHHINAFIDRPEVYTKFIKQFHLQDLAKKWIESFPSKEYMENTLSFFTEYNQDDHPLLEAISSLPNLNKKDVMETLYNRGLPVFTGRGFKDLLSLLNCNFTQEPKLVLLKELARSSIPKKEFHALKRFMKMNPHLSLDLISGLLEKQNADLLPIIIDQFIHLKTTNHPSSKDNSFTSLWKKTVDCSFNHPQMLLGLIPFYRNLGWIKSVYGVEIILETRKWAKTLHKTLGKQGKLTESDKAIIKEILSSRTKLKYDAEFTLTSFLASLNLLKYETTKESFHQTLDRLLVHINTDSNVRRYQFEILMQLIKLGIAAKFLTVNAFRLITDAMPCTPLLIDENGAFDPIFHLLQRLPLVDYESEGIYHLWNEERNETLKIWGDVRVLNQDCVKELLGSRELKTISYSTLKEILQYTHLFKLITEQFIEGNVRLEEFLTEIYEIECSFALKFESQDLLPNEDPCLICINDLLFFLKNPKEKRERGYTAFTALINQRKNSKNVKSKHLDEQLQYLKYRKKTEDLILLHSTQYTANHILYSSYMSAIHHHLIDVRKSYSFENIHIQDPIIDAFELESLHPMIKLDFLKLWIDKLKLKQPHSSTYHAKKVESQLVLEQVKLKTEDAKKHIEKRIDVLKKVETTKEKKKSEGDLILASAAYYLSDELMIQIHEFIEKKLDIKIDRVTSKLIKTSQPEKIIRKYNVNNQIEISQPETIIIGKHDIKSYLEYVSNQAVTVENLHNVYHESVTNLISFIENEKELQHYQFSMVLNLIKIGIEHKIISDFTFMGMMETKAPQFIVEAHDKVIHDPYVELLQSLSLADLRSEAETNRLNKQREVFFDYWIKQLKTSKKQSIISYANENITLEYLPYEKVKIIREYIQRFKSNIEDFILNKVNGDVFMEKISLLCVSAFQNIKLETFSKYTDPCLITLKELSHLLNNDQVRDLVYAAFNHLCVHWSINLKLIPQYLSEYRTYLNSRRAIEEQILSYNLISGHLLSIFEGSIPSNIHMFDPVFDALHLESLSIFDRLPALQEWVVELNKSPTPSAVNQSKAISSFIDFELKKIKEEDAEKVIREKIKDYNDLKLLLNVEETKNFISHIAQVGGTLLSQEKVRSLIMELFSEPVIPKKKPSNSWDLKVHKK